ncbi:Vomp family autotransporter [Bartonella harrusi]|uniref:Vomp family autotransporter n=1 Tax=Bartonella harrusi TaxID=2961895 RepID=A0ABY5ETU1_9HYPH|nr:Vomp family autotransporter [Bartonella harrusi]UTO28530.1 Vomp family autotransporter [Bartonella harrusi]
MKKLYTTLAMRNVRFFHSLYRVSFLKVASLGTAVVLFLSNTFPVFSANLDLTKVSLGSMKNAAVVYQQSTIFEYNDYTSGMGGYHSVINVLTADKRSVGEDMQNIFTASGAAVSDSGREKSAENVVISDSKKYTAKEKSVAKGFMISALGLDNIAIGSEYDNQKNIEEYISAKGYDSEIMPYGNEAIIRDKKAETRLENNIILGEDSGTEAAVGNRDHDSIALSNQDKESATWKSIAKAAAAIGYNQKKVMRQLEGEVADTDSSDAINVAQLTALQSYVEKGWMLSVGGKSTTIIGTTSVVDLSAASDNLKITKDNGDNNVKFDLADNVKVTSIIAGNSSMSGDGFFINEGPRITLDGIDAGNEKITGVAEGTEDTDAVNFAQLQAVKEATKTSWQLAVNSGDATAIGQNGTVNLQAAGSENKKNIKIEKDENHNVIFDLTDDIHVTSVTAGQSVMNGEGFHFAKGGPEVTLDGIDAGNKRIRGVAKGIKETDAVNFAQLKEIGNQIAVSSLVQQEAGNNLITIGKAVGGTEISLSNNDGEDRRISGVKAAQEDTDAVNKKQLEDSIADITDSIENNILVKQNKGENASITVGKATGGFEINIANKSGETRTISGVKAATKNNEAVNKEQLDGEIADITDSINVIKEANNFSVLYDKKNDNSVNYESITLGGDKTTAQVALHNVKAGTIAEDSHDAINGSQINKISEDVAAIFGGNAEFKDGILFGPYYHLSQIFEDGTSKNLASYDVGSALTGLDKNINNVNNRLTHVTNEFTQKIDGVSKDSLLWSDQEKAFVALHGEGKKENSKLTFLADGEISVDSTDAINGTQLFKLAQNTSKYFGGSADVLEGIEPTFVIQGKKHHNVTDAFTSVNISIKNIDDKIIEMKANNLVQQGGGITGIITIGKETAGTEIRIAGVGGVGRTISGLKEAERDDEAVNKSQLDKSIERISQDIETASAAVVLYDKNDDNTINYNSVTLGGKKSLGPVALLNIKDGKIAANSTDAITGNQLYLMSNQLAAYFGGGAGYKDGIWAAPHFKVAQLNADGTVGKEKSYDNVAEALGGVNNNIVSMNNRIDHVISKVDSDALKWNDRKKAYDADHDDQPNKIINVADGKIGQDSKDAINGGQLWKTNERVTNVEKDIKHIKNRVDNISNTIGDIGNTVLNIENKVDNIENTVHNLSDGVVNYDKTEDGKKSNKITLKGGNESEPVVIDNLADGRIEKGSKEAINGGQLRSYTEQQMKIVLDDAKNYTDQRVNNIVINVIDDAVEQANQYTDMKFNILNYGIKSVRKEARQAVAVGLAVSNLRYFDTPGSLSVSFGSGAWRGQSAFALGAGYTSENGKIRSNLSATSAGGHWGVGGAITLKIK